MHTTAHSPDCTRRDLTGHPQASARAALVCLSAVAAVAAVAGLAVVASLALGTAAQAQTAAPAPARNVILFVADGLRHGIVTPETAPTLTRFMQDGVAFANSHSVFPTFTTANASAMATGHQLGDTGDFSNTIYTGPQALPSARGSVTPFLESDPIIRDMDERFGGNYLHEETILSLARAAGYGTAAIGKLGPTLIMDPTDQGRTTIIFDDVTGKPGGVPLSEEIQAALKAAGLPLETPARGPNGNPGNATTPGTLTPNIYQQAYLTAAATQVVLPWLHRQGKPFVMVYWARDPDGTQHFHGDNPLQLSPGINGPSSLAAVRNVDQTLAMLLAALRSQGLADSTDVVVTSDHGFSTISKASDSSAAAHARYADVPKDLLPPGFLALDLARALGLPLFNPDQGNAPVPEGSHTNGNGLIGNDAAHPSVVVAANGGSDLVYLPGDDRAAIAPRVVQALLEQDYVSGVFVDDRLGPIPGTLPLSALQLVGSAVTPVPAIVVNFRSFHVADPTGRVCPTWLTCVANVADTALQQGQGMHGSFSRADTFNFTAAAGPSFKRGYVDRMPVSNADVGRTIAALLRLPMESSRKGELLGRVMQEAIQGGHAAAFQHGTLRSTPGAHGLQTIVHYEQVGPIRYLKAGGFAGRTAGLDERGRPDHLGDGR